MAPIITLEPKPLTPIEIGLNFAWMTRDGGIGLNGVTQIASPLTGLWEVSLVFEQANDARVRSYRAFKMQTKGRYVWIRVPIFDPFIITSGDIGPALPTPRPKLPWKEGRPLWSDGSGWRYPELVTTATAAGAFGDEEIELKVTPGLGDMLGIGHYFSINDFLYVITSVGEEVAPSSRMFGIGPPLREAVADNAEVKITRPTVLCRLAEDRSGSIRLRAGRFGQPSMDFIEVLERA